MCSGLVGQGSSLIVKSSRGTRFRIVAISPDAVTARSITDLFDPSFTCLTSEYTRYRDTRDACYLHTSILVVLSFLSYFVKPISHLVADHGLPGSPQPPGMLSHPLRVADLVVNSLLTVNGTEHRFRWI